MKFFLPRVLAVAFGLTLWQVLPNLTSKAVVLGVACGVRKPDGVRLPGEVHGVVGDLQELCQTSSAAAAGAQAEDEASHFALPQRSFHFFVVPEHPRAHPE